MAEVKPRLLDLFCGAGGCTKGYQRAGFEVVGVHGHHNYAGERELREKAMDIDWMSPYELTQAIPPAYTEHIGTYLMAAVKQKNPVRW